MTLNVYLIFNPNFETFFVIFNLKVIWLDLVKIYVESLVTDSSEHIIFDGIWYIPPSIYIRFNIKVLIRNDAIIYVLVGTSTWEENICVLT